MCYLHVHRDTAEGFTLHSEGSVIPVGANHPRHMQKLAVTDEVVRLVRQESLLSSPGVNHGTKGKRLLIPFLQTLSSLKDAELRLSLPNVC